MISQQHLCFAACLQIAVQETTGAVLDQVAIANHLGVVLPVGFDPSELVGQGVTNIRFESDPNAWGIEPVVAEINVLFKSANLLLECKFEPISKFQDWEFEDRLSALTESGQFPIVGFDYNSLFGEPGSGDWGHCVVAYHVAEMNRQSTVEIYDPGPSRAGHKHVDSYSLYRACRKKHGGIWSIAPLPTVG
jgi:hypothetical protein